MAESDTLAALASGSPAVISLWIILAVLALLHSLHVARFIVKLATVAVEELRHALENLFQAWVEFNAELARWKPLWFSIRNLCIRASAIVSRVFLL